LHLASFALRAAKIIPRQENMSTFCTFFWTKNAAVYPMAGDSLWHYFLFITDVSGRRQFGSQTLVAKPSNYLVWITPAQEKRKHGGSGQHRSLFLQWPLFADLVCLDFPGDCSDCNDSIVRLTARQKS